MATLVTALTAIFAWLVCLAAPSAVPGTESTVRRAFWTVNELAEYLGVSPATVHQWNYTGAGPRSYKVGRHRRYRPADVERWLEDQASDQR